MVKLPFAELDKNFYWYASQCCEVFEVDKDNRDQIRKIIDVFNADKPGMCVCGFPGSGKTLIFQFLQRIINPYQLRSNGVHLRFAIVNALDLVIDYNKVGHSVFHKYDNQDILLDDIGSEGKGKHYGDIVEVMEVLIQIRYNLWREKGIRTFLTTNCNKQEIHDRYGSRVSSRLSEMCEMIILGSSPTSDRRKKRLFKEFIPIHHERIMTEEDKAWNENYKAMKARYANGEMPGSQPGGMGSRLRDRLGVNKEALLDSLREVYKNTNISDGE